MELHNGDNGVWKTFSVVSLYTPQTFRIDYSIFSIHNTN